MRTILKVSSGNKDFPTSQGRGALSVWTGTKMRGGVY